MKKATNFILANLLLLTGFATLASSYVVWFVLPHGMGLHGGAAYCVGGGIGAAGNDQAFLGLLRYNWIAFHNWAAVALAGVVSIHIVIHWSWIAGTSQRIAAHLQRRSGKVLELYGTFVILLSCFAFECGSGLILWLALPRGERDYNAIANGSGRTFLGLARLTWSNLHAWVAVTIVSILVIHLILNWNWVAGITRKIFGGIFNPGIRAPQPETSA